MAEFLEMGTTLEFDGGVTIGWLVRRTQDWDEMTWSARKDARRKRKPAGQRRGQTVH